MLGSFHNDFRSYKLLYKSGCVKCESVCDADTDTGCRYELQIQIPIQLLLPDTGGGGVE